MLLSNRTHVLVNKNTRGKNSNPTGFLGWRSVCKRPHGSLSSYLFLINRTHGTFFHLHLVNFFYLTVSAPSLFKFNRTKSIVRLALRPHTRLFWLVFFIRSLTYWDAHTRIVLTALIKSNRTHCCFFHPHLVIFFT